MRNIMKTMMRIDRPLLWRKAVQEMQRKQLRRTLERVRQINKEAT